MTLVSVGFITIPRGATPGFDHADVYRSPDGSVRRLFVAHTGADRVEVIDCRTNTYRHARPDLPGVAGVLIDSEQDLIFTSDRGAARVSLFRASDEALLGRVAVGDRPNGLAYDPTRRRLFSFNLGEPPGTGCTLSAVDVDGRRVVATLPLPGRPRWAVYDPASDRVFANIRLPAQILVIDPAAPAVERAYAVPSAGPHGLAVDGTRLYCAADGGALVTLQRDSGAVLGTVPLPGEPDVVMLDPTLARLYVAIGQPGAVCSIDTERLALVETITTEPGAHTIGWSAADRTLYAFLPASSRVAAYVER